MNIRINFRRFGDVASRSGDVGVLNWSRSMNVSGGRSRKGGRIVDVGS